MAYKTLRQKRLIAVHAHCGARNLNLAVTEACSGFSNQKLHGCCRQQISENPYFFSHTSTRAIIFSTASR
jgi:hypothetical protein